MAISICRFYFEFDDPSLGREINLSHGGLGIWIQKRMKSIKEQLQGNEVKTINIVNIVLVENKKRAEHLNAWTNIANSLKYEKLYDLQGLSTTYPIENCKKLIKVASKSLLKAPYPQVYAIGELLSKPLSEADLNAIQLCLDKFLKKWSFE